ncbi:spore photoproduct lyase family protein [Pantanalinema rosaneae CENA516]|uniref:spore photoproduct lyase family protein n=1 Tax=Pantanalinema rosaneae TaxID=1620701 RepID=UPI003D6EC3B9
MPSTEASVVDIWTSPIRDRIAAINDFVEAGYEVHVNFAPVIYYQDWLADYQQLFEEIDDTLLPPAKEQLQAEVILLTHNDRLHEVNLGWHPQAKGLLWQPNLQETKLSQTGGKNVRYKRGLKGTLVDGLCGALEQQLPYCTIRYAF